MKIQKSVEKSKLLRSEGNEFYKERNFYDAIIKYNQSLCFSEIGSENFGLVYANRSAVCFELRLYEKCLKNISLARSHNYPIKNLDILNKREGRCKELIGRAKSNVKEKFFKLSHECHPKVSYISNVLEMKTNEKYGRHIVTKKDLNVGDIVAIEAPFCSVLLTQSKFVRVDSCNNFLRCSYCLKSNLFELVPCEICCGAMFCEECKKEAFRKFHRFECAVFDELSISGSVHIALRIFFIALSAFDGSINDLQTFMTEIDKERHFNIFDVDTKQANDVKSYLKILNSLSRSDTTFPLLKHEAILENHPELSQVWRENKKFIRDFLQRQCQTNDHYFHGIFGVNLKAPNSKAIKDIQQSIGSGWFPFCSLINHSCCSNVMRIYVNGRVALVVSRFIQSGEQLFDCYKTSFINTPKAERQLRLKQEFNFLCDCEACLKNYPTLQNLSIKSVSLAKSAKKIEDELISSNNLDGNFRIFKECSQLIEDNQNEFPSVELILLQKCFALYLLLQAKNESDKI